MKRIYIAVLLIIVSAILFVHPGSVSAGCSGGTPTGCNKEVRCPDGCIEGFNCTCERVCPSSCTSAREFCGDAVTQSQCNSSGLGSWECQGGGGSCSWSEPAPPPSNNIYGCNNSGQCVSGLGSMVAGCGNVCRPPVAKYKCSGGACIQAADGNMGAGCNNSCGGIVTGYGCNLNGQCVAGLGSLPSTCNGPCPTLPPTQTYYGCNGSNCQAGYGSYTSSSCNNSCGGVTGVCNSKADCGDPDNVDCCNHSCVPIGQAINCSPGVCTAPADEYDGTVTHIRFLSNENGTATAWKGPDWTDSIVPVSADGKGSFYLFKGRTTPSQLDGNKNKIDNSMFIDWPRQFGKKVGEAVYFNEVRLAVDPDTKHGAHIGASVASDAQALRNYGYFGSNPMFPYGMSFPGEVSADQFVPLTDSTGKVVGYNVPMDQFTGSWTDPSGNGHVCSGSVCRRTVSLITTKPIGLINGKLWEAYNVLGWFNRCDGELQVMEIFLVSLNAWDESWYSSFPNNIDSNTIANAQAQPQGIWNTTDAMRAAWRAAMVQDGYWSLTYSSHDQYLSIALNTGIVVRPPAGYKCKAAYKFNPSGRAINLPVVPVNDVCQIEEVAGEYDDDPEIKPIVIVELERDVVKACTVKFRDLDADTTGVYNPKPISTNLNENPDDVNFEILLDGSSTSLSKTDRVNLWISKVDQTPAGNAFSDRPQISNSSMLNSVLKADGTRTTVFDQVKNSLNQYYYRVRQPLGNGLPCDAGGSPSNCSITVPIGAPGNALDEGLYAVHCDLMTYPGESCSGNPYCAYNVPSPFTPFPSTLCNLPLIGTLDQCKLPTGQPANTSGCGPELATACNPGAPTGPGPAAANAGSFATFSVSCESSCNSCSTTDEIDSCTGSACPAGEKSAVKSTKPNITQVNSQSVGSSNPIELNLTSATITLPISWTPVNTAETYDVIAYPIDTNTPAFLPAGAKMTIPQIKTAESAANVVAAVRSATNYEIPLNSVVGGATLKGKSPLIRVLVRACNSLCLCSDWESQDVRLLSEISVGYYEIGARSCTDPPTAAVQPSFTYGVPTVVTYNRGLTFKPTDLPVGGVSNSNPLSPNQVLSNIWYAPDKWFGASDGRYTVTPPLSQLKLNNYITACTSPTVNVDAPSTVNIYVKQAFDAWWRTIGGLIAANGAGSDKDIVSDIPPTCQGLCIAALSGFAGASLSDDTSRSAGLSIAGNGGKLTTGNGFKTQNRYLDELFADNNTSIKLPVTANYEYFANLIGKTEETQSTIAPADAATFQPKAGAAVTIGSGTEAEQIKLWKIKQSNTTFNLSNSVWNIGDEKIVIMVDGNLELQGWGAAPFTTATSNGFLLIVASGNITFKDSVGKPVALDLINNTTPLVRGIFIADGQIIIDDDGNEDISDKQFVGQGVFAGLSGFQIKRKFDDNGMNREFNNTIPAELFIHDPQMVLNTPKFLREPMMSYQEVL